MQTTMITFKELQEAANQGMTIGMLMQNAVETDISNLSLEGYIDLYQEGIITFIELAEEVAKVNGPVDYDPHMIHQLFCNDLSTCDIDDLLAVLYK